MRTWISFLLLLMGCAAQEQQPLRLLLDWWPNPDHVPIYVGIKKGFFLDEDVEIEVLKTADPPQALLFLLSGRTDIILHNAPHTVSVLGLCPDLRLCGILIDRPLRSFVFLKDSEIREPYDLHHKVLGGNPEGLLTAYVQGAMKKWGIQFREIRKMSWDAPTALLTGAVDVIAGIFWNIEPEQLRAAGVETRFFPIEMFGVPTYDELVFVTLRELTEQDPTFVERFKRALQHSIDWCRENPEEAFEIYVQAQPGKGPRVLAWERKAWEVTAPLCAYHQVPVEEKWKHLLEWMQAQDLVRHPTDLTPFLGLPPNLTTEEARLKCVGAPGSFSGTLPESPVETDLASST
ncbi:MAG: ABC transporter substrate-binding protein [Chlamydiia bacterium]